MKSRRSRGDGSIRRLRNGNFQVIISLGVNPITQKRERISKVFAVHAEALAWKRDRLREQQAGQITSTTTTFGEWLDGWLAGRAASASANTLRTENNTAKHYLSPYLGLIPFRKLDRSAIEKWLLLLIEKTTHNERRKAAILLRLVLNEAVRRGVILASPMKGIGIPARVVNESAALTAEQLAALLAAAEELGHGLLFRVWADTGLRPGELYGLLWSDWDEKRGLHIRRAVCGTTGKLKPPKTRGSRRLLVLAPTTSARLLAARPADHLDRPMFPTPRTGSHWTNQNFTKYVFNPVSAKAGLLDVCSPYTIRHTMATLLLQAGVSLKVVSERLGHDDVITTLKSYAHVLPGMQELAAQTMETLLPKETTNGPQTV